MGTAFDNLNISYTSSLFTSRYYVKILRLSTAVPIFKLNMKENKGKTWKIAEKDITGYVWWGYILQYINYYDNKCLLHAVQYLYFWKKTKNNPKPYLNLFLIIFTIFRPNKWVSDSTSLTDSRLLSKHIFKEMW